MEILTSTGGYFESDATSNKTYVATGAAPSIENAGGSVSSISNSTRVGALFTFSEEEVISRVGISWISPEQACDNVNREIPAGTSFATVVNDAVSEWNEKVLSKITTTNTNDTSLSLLYTSLYFMHLIPTNQTGENPGWESDEPYYQDIFTFWVSSLHRPMTSRLDTTNELRIYSAALHHSCKSSNQLLTRSKFGL
jgi:putative alpha-1,2-mannosidase